MRGESKLFYPKILLFGEYSVILGGRALAIPYGAYEGELIVPAQMFHSESNRELKTFFQYLKSADRFSDYTDYFDFSGFQFELNQGLYFHSNIPQGYGVGSSGAVTASIIDRYMDKDYVASLSLKDLKKCMGIMESHFHGKSSGLDPLVSFYNHSIMFTKDQIDFYDVPRSHPKGEVVIFLVDTGRSRRTEALVNLFIEKLKNPIFAKACSEELIPYNERCIKSFNSQNILELFQDFYQISSFEYRELHPMIPKVYLEKWERGLKNKKTLLKLCGAGGGGFLLGITQNFSELGASDEWRDEQVKVLFKFPLTQ